MSNVSRRVERIVEPQLVMEGAGVRLRRSIATRTLDYVDPFLLFDHFGSDDPRDYLAGFPMHPHRGIETVTYLLAGAVSHRDSIGNAGTLGPGDVQWMTAGRGILHEEMPKPVQGRMDGFQLWVNLPAAEKMTRARYQEVASGLIPTVGRGGQARIRVIAGEVDGVRGPVTQIVAEPTYLDVTLEPGSSFEQPIPWGHSALAYLFEGGASFGPPGDAPHGAVTVGHPRLLIWGDGDRIEVRTGREPARFLVISGKPLGEPIARYGPFVMNTREEILQTLREMQAGTFPPP